MVEAVDVYFGLRFKDGDLQSSIDRLIGGGHLQRAPGGTLVPAPQARAEIDLRVQEAHQLEDKVQNEWLKSIWESKPGRDAAADKELWECLRTYMAQAFERHGAQTTLLLDPAANLPAELDKSLGTYLKQAITQTCHSVPPEQARTAVREFFAGSTPARSRYIAQLLDGTFSFFAICVDEVTSSYLNRAIQPVSIFLDTNFVFGLLRLHDNPLNQVSEELVEAIREHQFPFKLFYHERTLREFQSAIRNIRDRMLTYSWTQELSRAATHLNSLSTIELRYHEANSRSPVDARAFLTKYEHIEELLREKGFTVYREPQRTLGQLDDLDKEQTLLIAKYNGFLVSRGGFDHAKRYRTIEHDMVVWQTVKYLRRQGSSVLDIGALFLTADQNLYAFDWQKMRQKGETGHVILPNQLLQLLRPFLVVTADFDEKFAATFAIPEFRTVASGYAGAASKVLGYLTTLADVTEETASRILANEVLLGRLRDLSLDAPQFKELIDSELVHDNEKLLKENQLLLNAVSEVEQARAGVASELSEKQTLLEQHKRLVNEQQALATVHNDELRKREQQLLLEKAARVQKELEAQALEQKVEDSEALRRASELALKQLESKHTTLATIVRILVAAVAFISGTVLVYYVSSRWPWLAHHTRRLGITLCGILVLAGICWCIADTDSRRRRIAIVALVIASIVTLIQVIDSESHSSAADSSLSSPALQTEKP